MASKRPIFEPSARATTGPYFWDYGLALPTRTLPYTRPSENRPTRQRKTSNEVRAYASTAPVTSRVSDPARPTRRLTAAARRASPSVVSMMTIRIPICFFNRRRSAIWQGHRFEFWARRLSGSAPRAIKYNAWSGPITLTPDASSEDGTRPRTVFPFRWSGRSLSDDRIASAEAKVGTRL